MVELGTVKYTGNKYRKTPKVQISFGIKVRKQDKEEYREKRKDGGQLVCMCGI